MTGVAHKDVVVIGGGQAGLALGYYLRRTQLDWVILDDQEQAGGAWTQTWDSLRLFSPARWSSLPGRLMEGGEDEYPTRDEALAYFDWYEQHYDLPVERPVRVEGVSRSPDPVYPLLVRTSAGRVATKAVISATGTFGNPVMPEVDGSDRFHGQQIHSASYRTPDVFAGQRVAVVGAGNSAAQILAELSTVADVFWCTIDPPKFLPDEVDGRYLFEQATLRYKAEKEGRPVPPPASLGDIVVVPSVRRALDRGALNRLPMFVSLNEAGATWSDRTTQRLDAVIWATGFKAALKHLEPLDIIDANGRIETDGTRSVAEPRLWLVGYGSWTGYASATIIGVGRTARETVKQVAATIEE